MTIQALTIEELKIALSDTLRLLDDLDLPDGVREKAERNADRYQAAIDSAEKQILELAKLDHDRKMRKREHIFGVAKFVVEGLVAIYAANATKEAASINAKAAAAVATINAQSSKCHDETHVKLVGDILNYEKDDILDTPGKRTVSSSAIQDVMR